MELNNKNINNVSNNSTIKTVSKEVSSKNDFNGNGIDFETFQSKDLILGFSKDIEARKSGGRDGDGHVTGPSHSTGYVETLMHHFKSNVGSGIFALGDAFKNAGLFLAPPLTIFLGFICVHAQHMLLRCNEEVARRMGNPSGESWGYAETVELCFSTGPVALRKYSVFMRKLVRVFLCITQLGFCSVYFVFISTNMQQDLPPVSERRYVSDWKMLPMFFGSVIYSFEGINLVLPLKNEMKKPRNFNKPLGVLNVGYSIIGTMFILLGFLAYLKYGDDVQGSVTLNLESQTSNFPHIIKFSISLSILMSYALQLYVLVDIMWPSVQNRFGPCGHPAFSEIMFRLGLCLFTFILAEAVPHLELFISLVGAVSSAALALIFPPIIEMVLSWQNATLDKFTFVKDVFILLIGLLGCVTGTYESIVRILQKAFSPET